MWNPKNMRFFRVASVLVRARDRTFFQRKYVLLLFTYLFVLLLVASFKAFKMYEDGDRVQISSQRKDKLGLANVLYALNGERGKKAYMWRKAESDDAKKQEQASFQLCWVSFL